MKEDMFRKSSLKKFISPDKLDGYVKAPNLGIWMLLGGTVLLLISAGIWIGAAG